MFSRKDLLKMLKPNKTIVIQATASWCTPCKNISPYVQTICPTNIKLLKIDVDKHRDLTSYLKITKLPTFISYFGTEKMDILASANRDEVCKFFQKVQKY